MASPFSTSTPSQKALAHTKLSSEKFSNGNAEVSKFLGLERRLLLKAMDFVFVF